ncbi:hypothetical protein M8C21_028065 [Ambrosia artemisiifolia]|uniref:Uncharacterized protein n=1 Tax=Ambrosia artemisiifolia TaxID=4212 RepID=A0AAD5GDN2_AMBAR|nr:hypothetical protein M8C21_028065 [Ambrosia artemisiifolia]
MAELGQAAVCRVERYWAAPMSLGLQLVYWLILKDLMCLVADAFSRKSEYAPNMEKYTSDAPITTVVNIIICYVDVAYEALKRSQLECIEDLWKQIFPVGTEWDQLDLLAEYNWNFNNLEICGKYPYGDQYYGVLAVYGPQLAMIEAWNVVLDVPEEVSQQEESHSSKEEAEIQNPPRTPQITNKRTVPSGSSTSTTTRRSSFESTNRKTGPAMSVSWIARSPMIKNLTLQRVNTSNQDL